MLGFGFSFTLDPCVRDYQKKPNLAYQAFNIYLEQILKKHLIEIEGDKKEVFHALSEIDPCFEQNSLNRKHLIAEGINKMSKTDTQKFKQLSELSQKAEDLLSSYNLSFKHFKHPVNVKSLDITLLILLLPITLIGLCLNWWIYFASKGFAGLLPKKHQQFYTSVRFGAATLLWLLWTTTLTIGLSFFSLWFLFTPLIMFISIKTLIKTKRKIMKIKRLFALKRLQHDSKNHHDLIEYIKELMNYRNENELIP
jgi:hypothetical protein